MATRARSDGTFMMLSIADSRLCLLWRLYGSSWSALEERVSQAPGAAAKLAAVCGLHARLGAARERPPRLLSREITVAGLEDALRWLNEAPAESWDVAMADVDVEMAALDTATLIARLPASFPRMPRREMQELLRRGGAAVPGLTALLLGGDRRLAPEPLWAIVVLGELRHPDAIEALGRFLTGGSGAVGTAAAEALGKIGAPAVPYLAAAAARGGHARRLYAYSALGMIRTDDAYRYLRSGLVSSPELGDVIARALVQHGRPDAIEFLHACNDRAPRWMRREFASAIFALMGPPCPPEPVEHDWRLRYRRLPGLNWGFPFSWVSVAALVHRRRRALDEGAGGAENGNVRRPRRERAVQRAAAAGLDAAQRLCGRCGARIWRPTGVPLCRHTAPQLLALQGALIDRWRAAGLTDAWQALDECDAADVRFMQRRSSARPAGGVQERARTALARSTLYWLVALGREDLGLGVDYLRVVARDLAALYGEIPLP
jgi:hypothetical protein